MRAVAVGVAVGLAFVAALAIVVIRAHGHLFARAGAVQGLADGANSGLTPVASGTSGSTPGKPAKPGGDGTPTTATSPAGGGAANPTSGTGNRPDPGPGSPGAGSTAPVGPGDYQVGVDIAAGAWTTTGPLNVSICTYSVNGQPAIQITLVVVGTTVHLAAGDTFRTSGCAQWRYAG
jgi:hypothetical protein